MRELAPPHIPRALTDREDKLNTLFERWNDVTPMMSGSRTADHFAAGEAGCALMPLAWNLSYRKLEVLMRYMSHVAAAGSPEFKGRHAHMCEWYGRGRWVRVKEKRTDKFTKKKYEAEALRFQGGPRADLRRVLEALDWLQGHFPGEVYLPREFLDIAA